LAAHYEKKHDWQHILGKIKLTALSGKNHDWQHILEVKMIDSTFWEKHD
jgi:hypothetical protein